jgi:thioredoxin-dependent peroxiredoxin
MTAPTAGDMAPDFTLVSDSGEAVSLSSLRGRRVVLYFYPKDETPGCTTQACEFRDLGSEFSRRGALILGVSRDGRASHLGFKSHHNLDFPLLSDPDHAVHDLYGAWGTRRLAGREATGALRTTVVIDENGVITHIEHGVKAEGNAAATLALL